MPMRKVDRSPGGGLASYPRASDAGEDGRDDLVAEGEQGGDGAGGWCWGLVAQRPAWLDDEVLWVSPRT